MRSRMLVIAGAAALGIMPALATSGAASGPLFAASDPVINAKLEALVIGVVDDAAGGTRVELGVVSGSEWPGEDTGARKEASQLLGRRIDAHVTAASEILVGDRPAAASALKPGATITVLLRTNASPVSPARTYELRQVRVIADAPTASAPVDPGASARTPTSPSLDAGFEPGFFARRWAVNGGVRAVERTEGATILNLDVRQLVNGAARFRDEGRRLARLDAYVIVGPKTVVVDGKGRRVPTRGIGSRDRVRVVGAFPKPERWVIADSTRRAPTMTATRVTVIARG